MNKRIWWKGVLSVWWRNALMYSKTWKLNLLPNFFEPVFFLIGLGLGVGFYIQQINGVPYPVFLAPGLIAIAAMNGASFESTYNVYVRMNYNRTYDGILATPVNENEIVLGEMFWSITRAWIYGGAFYLITCMFGLIPSWWSVGVLGVLVLTGYLFAGIGMTFSFVIPAIDLFSVYFTLFLTPLYIFSDTFFPLQERLGSQWMWIAELNPLFHCVRLTRAFTMGEFSSILIWDLIYIIAVGGLFHTLALRQFKKRIHQPAR
ncbi:MAG: ABC transporter permease [Deltaproteobacteria bacterium]|nr:ABC transporter permease [Deltaproteobacteria bacterium]